MLKNYLDGSASGIIERFGGSGGGLDAKRSIRQPGSENITSGPRATAAATATDLQQTGFWSLLISSLIEGLALYGASVHSMGFFPPPPDEPLSSAPRDIAVRRWRGPIRVVSSTGPQDAASTRVDRDVARLAQVGPRSASEGRREREIQKAAAALARFDDRTLLGLGIPHRSYIEQTVRFCHDC